MSVRDKPSTLDGRLEESFGAAIADLYETADSPDAPAAVTRAMQLRSFLALTEEQVNRARAHLHGLVAPGRDLDGLYVYELRMSAQWLESALDARDTNEAALADVLHTMPPPGQQPRPARRAPGPATTLPPAVTAPPPRAGAARAPRP
ncbi:hypothetical protein ABZ820_05055 [Streptomyces diacarni]|uniref:hypothetical protein n=1 Tax=Streptomyces diacarni TaxID=2800381 RepID=UPI0034015A22